MIFETQGLKFFGPIIFKLLTSVIKIFSMNNYIKYIPAVSLRDKKLKSTKKYKSFEVQTILSIEFARIRVEISEFTVFHFKSKKTPIIIFFLISL